MKEDQGGVEEGRLAGWLWHGSRNILDIYWRDFRGRESKKAGGFLHGS